MATGRSCPPSASRQTVDHADASRNLAKIQLADLGLLLVRVCQKLADFVLNGFSATVREDVTEHHLAQKYTLSQRRTKAALSLMVRLALALFSVASV